MRLPLVSIIIFSFCVYMNNVLLKQIVNRKIEMVTQSEQITFLVDTVCKFTIWQASFIIFLKLFIQLGMQKCSFLINCQFKRNILETTESVTMAVMEKY